MLHIFVTANPRLRAEVAEQFNRMRAAALCNPEESKRLEDLSKRLEDLSKSKTSPAPKESQQPNMASQFMPTMRPEDDPMAYGGWEQSHTPHMIASAYPPPEAPYSDAQSYSMAVAEAGSWVNDAMYLDAYPSDSDA